MKKIVTLTITLLLCIMFLNGCTKKDEKNNDLIVLFTNDIHGGILDNQTLSAVATYKQKMQESHKNVLLVDCGDAIQGTSVASISDGEAIINAMNVAGYDYAVLGNHEFDYGLPRLAELLKIANAKYLNANITYHGQKTSYLSNTVPYEIKDFGNMKVAFIGITTPSAVTNTSKRMDFIEDGEYVYDFAGGKNEEALCELVQSYVDEARQKGANYVVVMAHLGINTNEMLEYTSTELINNTRGIDVLLDGHSHSTDIAYCVPNIDGDYVLVGQTGTKLANMGKLVISSDGTISIANISDLWEKDKTIDEKITSIYNKEYSKLDVTIFHNETNLSISDKNGVRMVRNRETGIGNLVADAYRFALNGDIAYTNGAGIRDDLPSGDVTWNDIISINPFGNMLCMVELKGKDILDMLEYFVSHVEKDYVNEKGEALGEFSSFPHMSGIEFTVDTKIPTSIILNDEDMLTAVGTTRRVKDVKVLENGLYVPIDKDKTYNVILTDYVVKQGGSGMQEYMKDKNIVVDSAIADYDALTNYIIDELKGDLSRYAEPDGRITIK